MRSPLLIILTLLTTINCIAQKDSNDHRHFIALQFGGQTMVSFHYEYSLIVRKHLVLKSNIGLGLNENADDKDPNDRPIYGIHSGLILLIGARTLNMEIGINPTTYFYRKTTFVNLNGWIGARITPKKMGGISIGLGYTPRLYTTFTDPTNRFFNAIIGMKCGVTL